MGAHGALAFRVTEAPVAHTRSPLINVAVHKVMPRTHKRARDTPQSSGLQIKANQECFDVLIHTPGVRPPRGADDDVIKRRGGLWEH